MNIWGLPNCMAARREKILSTVRRFKIAVLLGALCLTSCAEKVENHNDAPNIILIVADDLGFTDLGVFGSEIDTPNLDALSNRGAIFTNFHTNSTCTPSRAMLLTGRSNHAVGFGANPGVSNRVPALKGRQGYLGEFSAKTRTLSAVLNDYNYQTYMVGKWHLGKTPNSFPMSQGFDRSFFLKEGGASHFDDQMGTLSSETKASYFEDGQLVEALDQNFFSTTVYTDKAISYLESSHANDPFFLYLAFTAPHWPLQAPDDWLDKYKGQYDAGWSPVWNERTSKLLRSLLPTASLEIDEPSYFDRWETLSDAEKKVESRRMEIYAAMISHMDNQIGRLLSFIEASGKANNTIIIFTSDNGPEGNDVLGIRANRQWVPDNFDLSYENMGRKGSYVYQGREWADVSNGPLRLYKSYLSGGGTRVPAIIYDPRMKAPAKNDKLVSVMDIAPTILDWANIPAPENMEGHSLLRDDIRPPLSMESYGNRSVQDGDWKLLWLWPDAGQGKWALYDVEKDPAESRDVASQYPEIVSRLTKEWDKFSQEKNVYKFDRDIGYGRYPEPEADLK